MELENVLEKVKEIKSKGKTFGLPSQRENSL